jgi:hypothetical protein
MRVIGLIDPVTERQRYPQQRTSPRTATKTSAWPLSPARKADVAFYPSCQWGVPKSPIIAMGSTSAVGRHHTFHQTIVFAV